MEITKEKLAELLVEPGHITGEDLDRVWKRAEETKQKPVDLLVEEGLISNENLGRTIADGFGYRFLDPQNENIDKTILSIIPETVARAQQAIAYDMDDQAVYVTTTNPDNDAFFKLLEKKTGKKINIAYTTAPGILSALHAYKSNLRERVKELVEVLEKDDHNEDGIITLVNLILEYAYDNGTSDIHVEPQKRIAIMDFGGQSAHLISRRVRQFGFDVEIVSPRVSKSDLQAFSGIILSGGARSVYEKNAPTIAKDILLSGTPILGICYGHQLIAHVLGGKVDKGATGEYGPSVFKAGASDLFKGIKSSLVWMNHRDTVTKLPKGFVAIGTTPTTPIAAYESKALKIQSVQFHPEVTHTKHGEKMIENFLKGIGSTKKTKGAEIEKYVNEAKQTIGTKKAIIGLSGGVDSSVAAVLVSRAIGKNLCAVFVDTGFMRLGEAKEIKDTFRSYGLNLKIVDASKMYFKALRGVSDPEQKRKIIGKTFIEIFDKEAKAFGATFLIQGTIYSDRIESGLTKHSSKIKSHHNVGGLPKHMKLTVYEPLRDLYKDEVRALAADLKLPDAITHRQVFPGPGFAIRVIGDLTPERVSIVQRADMIIQDELGKAKLLSKIWMAFPVLLTIKSVGIEGDERSYKYPLVLRIVESKDAMTANFAKIPHDILGRISTRITNEIREVNRVVYDISNKPPATMEWE